MPYLTPSDRLWKEVAAIVADEGLSLYDLERKGGASLRVFLERPEGKITSGDCSQVCRRLMVFFLAEGEAFGVGKEPEIEVSSPGVNRQLRLREHYERSIGERVRVTLSGSRSSGSPGTGGSDSDGSADANASRKEKVALVGELREVRDGEATVVDESDGEVVTFQLARVKRAQVDFQFGEPRR